MANNKITEGVGRKIVEALKMQSDVEITPIENEDLEIVEEETFEPVNAEEPVAENNMESEFVVEEPASPAFDEEPIFEQSVTEQPVFEQPMFEQPVYEQPTFEEPKPANTPQLNPQYVDDFEVPSNVAVLKQLITKLPAGVTKQTGALIIKQTMEALGISMKSVLQEAQQVQEGLNNSSRECQASIMEYKRQIGILEKQAQKYQRQYAALNDIISLFVQTSI